MDADTRSRARASSAAGTSPCWGLEEVARTSGTMACPFVVACIPNSRIFCQRLVNNTYDPTD